VVRCSTIRAADDAMILLIWIMRDRISIYQPALGSLVAKPD
jgi:hypothetical protein